MRNVLILAMVRLVVLFSLLLGLICGAFYGLPFAATFPVHNFSGAAFRGMSRMLCGLFAPSMPGLCPAKEVV